jgi:type IV pilus assembly protein PilC
MAGEYSGNLSKALKKIGVIYEEKTEMNAKNLTVILEPILLIVIACGVLGVAIAVILPIYSLVGGMNNNI